MSRCRQDRHISLFIYDFLCKTIGTEDVVQNRRMIHDAFDRQNILPDYRQITGGSRGEGLDLEGSDIDVMFICNTIDVYEDIVMAVLAVKGYIIGKGRNFNNNKIKLFMDTTDSSIGFTRLESCGNISNDILKLLRPIIDMSTYPRPIYISSKGLREQALPIHEDMIIHGPCSSLVNGSLDCVFCLHCPDWIWLSNDWLKRSRINKFSSVLMDSITDFGVLFVPIGEKGSAYEDTEFRISFAVAEKQLIRSFNHVQLLCYALMKIVLKDILKEKYDDSFSSYMIKTSMLWLFEETVAATWRPEALLFCFMNCFERFRYYVKYKTCPHYFIPKVNLFEDKIDAFELLDDLLSTLESLSSHDFMLLLNAKTMQPLRDMFEPLPADVSTIACSLPQSYYEVVEKKPTVDHNVKRALNMCQSESSNISDYILYSDGVVCQYYRDYIYD